VSAAADVARVSLPIRCMTFLLCTGLVLGYAWSVWLLWRQSHADT
jgi:hypothetical protein